LVYLIVNIWKFSLRLYKNFMLIKLFAKFLQRLESSRFPKVMVFNAWLLCYVNLLILTKCIYVELMNFIKVLYVDSNCHDKKCNLFSYDWKTMECESQTIIIMECVALIGDREVWPQAYVACDDYVHDSVDLQSRIVMTLCVRPFMW